MSVLLSCPYCGINFDLNGVDHDNSFLNFGSIGRHLYGGPLPTTAKAGPQENWSIRVQSHLCPSCHERIAWLTQFRTKKMPNGHLVESETKGPDLFFPKQRKCLILGTVPEPYATEYREAYYTLDVSPKASAALSRRCLQLLIHNLDGIKEKDLYNEIKKLLALNKLPQHLADDLDAIRNVGNFAAHPIKDTTTNAIVDVEPAEAEWTLSLVEQLLRFYFVDLPAAKAKRDALNQKLTAAGKKPML